MVVDTSGYELLSFSLDTDWVATKVNVEVVDIDCEEDKNYADDVELYADSAEYADYMSCKVKYFVHKMKKTDMRSCGVIPMRLVCGEDQKVLLL
uniref:Uncharacterized protein n=1 Tax=Oryza meridionalis TaxID=40149 RepID=A0A0E0E5L1_9ORYZ